MAQMLASKILEDGSRLEILVDEYADRFLVLITQLGKIGTLLQATIPDTTPLPPPSSTGIPEPPAAVHVHSLLGSAPSERNHALHSIYATHAATLVWVNDIASATGSSRRPVIVGIALELLRGDQQTDEAERMVFTTAMDMLANLLRTT